MCIFIISGIILVLCGKILPNRKLIIYEVNMSNYYNYNEISYNKGYELEDVDIYNAMDKKTSSLTASTEALESFLNCVIYYNTVNNIVIDTEKLREVCNGCLLIEGSVFGAVIDYEKLFETYKEITFETFLNHLFNLREAISICILNELGKKRTELEYALTLSEKTTENFELFKQTMEELFSQKCSTNRTYTNADSYLDEYINDNLMNLQRNIISGNPLHVAENMLKKMKGEN